MNDNQEGFLPLGTQVWFPSKWECGTIDSILSGPGGTILAYVIKKEDGTKVAIDMQTVEPNGMVQ
jgi:hypothetical protein